MTTIRIRFTQQALVLCALLACALTPIASAESINSTVPQTWQMLDYLATDYAGAVHDGAITSASEYAEMKEFAATVRTQLQALPPTPSSAGLVSEANTLVAMIEAKAALGTVADQAHGLADHLLQAYPVPTAPDHTPDLARGSQIYQSQCAACHGLSGHGDGPAGLHLSPAPIDFTDLDRADQRSPMSLYEAISQGVAGTSMAGYAEQLSLEDRWALAYYVGSLAYQQEAVSGANAWHEDATTRAQIASLKELSAIRVAQLSATLGQPRARAVVGYLRANPQALQQALSGVPLARARMSASLVAYRSGSHKEATQLALSAYLDGVELIEPQLSARDGALRAEIETAMGAYRTDLSKQSPLASISSQAETIDALLARAELALAEGSGDAFSIFLGALAILLREGLEALLVVVALLAFLRKAGQTAAIRFVHAGWILALVAGAITWVLARYVISISGASRELTEGLSSLFAALVLLSVGLWMHQKSIGGRWQAYLKEQMAAALSRKSAWFLFGLAFISVYREVFETILFYAALWNEGQEVWLLGGILVGSIILAAIAWMLLRTSRRLPIGQFFAASSALIAVLSVVLAGKGVSALQEAGWIALSPAPIPRFEILGIYPTWQTLLAQLIVLALLVCGYFFNAWRARGNISPLATVQPITPADEAG